MRNNALYFPYIDVPRTSWLHQMALYWDSVLSIVPHDYLGERGEATRFMREAVDSKLVTPVWPGQFYMDLVAAREPFVSYIDSEMARRPPSMLNVNACPNPVRLHMEKVDFISTELEHRKLIKIRNHGPWFDAVPWVANAFMAYLASCIGSLQQVNAWPVTDQDASFHVLNGTARFTTQATEATRTEVRELVLREVLPTPLGAFDVQRLLRFKERHQDALKRFRGEIETTCNELADFPDKQRKNQCEREARRLRKVVDDLAGEMHGEWKRIVFRDLVPIIGIASTIVTNAAATNPNPYVQATGLVTLTGAIHRFKSGLEERKRRRSNSMAYAAFVRNKLAAF